MDELILALWAICSVYLLRAPRAIAVGLILASALVFPEFLRVTVGPAQMSLMRLLALTLALSLFLKRNGLLQWHKVDTLVISLWLWTVLASLLAGSSDYVVQYIGAGLDTVLVYFVVRLSINNQSDLRSLVMILSGCIIILGSLGLYEAITFDSPYRYFDQYKKWSWIEKEPEFRLGLLRAKGSTLHNIVFGTTLVALLGLCWIGSALKVPRGYTWAALICAFLGIFSSLSSGAWLGLAGLLVFRSYQTRRQLIRPTVLSLAAISLVLEVLSNRHFYNLIDYLALNSQTAWYRTRLLEVAVGQWREFWLVGVGDQIPHHWGALIDGRKHVDVVNHFLLIGLQSGFLGVGFYVGSHYVAIKFAGSVGQRLADDSSSRIILYFLCCTLLAIDFMSLSVSLFGPERILGYAILGIIVSYTQNVRSESLSLGTQRLSPSDQQKHRIKVDLL